MQSDSIYKQKSSEFYKYPRKTRGPRFALIILIIMAIISIAIALTIAYVFT
jgi:hypothetical protein